MQFYSFVFGKGKSSYSFTNNLRYTFREMYRFKKRYFYISIFGFIPLVLASFVETLLPARLVADLEAGERLLCVLFHLGILSLLAWVCNTANGMIAEYSETIHGNFVRHFQKKYVRKMMDVDYDLLENQEFQKVAGNAANSVKNSYTMAVMCSVPLLLGQLALGFLYAGILCTVNPWLALAVMVTVVLNMWLLSVARKKHAQYHRELSVHARRISYLNSQSTLSSAGKDIRIYHMLDWFLGKMEESLGAIGSTFGKIHTWYMVRSLSDAVFVFLRNGFVYAYLLYQLVNQMIVPSEFVFYIGLVNGLAGNFGEVLHMMLSFNSTSVEIGYIRQLLSYESHWNRGEGIGKTALAEMLEKPVKIELRDVSFTYPGKKTPTISHLNLTIRAGEKLALIGLNGAGKTTLVKIICGFYHPTAGEIRINDIPRSRFSREEYGQIMSVQFQDAVFLPITLGENITGQKKEERKREHFLHVLKSSGFFERFKMLKEKEDTLLVKEVNEKAMDFSGGEKQKIMFARALYKNVPLMILDEPTAALDPIAENELYLNFNEASRNKTVLYISHRLSSTRFCDRIILLQDGKIVEEGTHEQLMEQGGIYEELFWMQSQYYKEKQEKEERSRNIREAFGEEGGEAVE